MSSCCKIIAASDDVSLCAREGAFLLWNGKKSAVLLCFSLLWHWSHNWTCDQGSRTAVIHGNKVGPGSWGGPSAQAWICVSWGQICWLCCVLKEDTRWRPHCPSEPLLRSAGPRERMRETISKAEERLWWEQPGAQLREGRERTASGLIVPQTQTVSHHPEGCSRAQGLWPAGTGPPGHTWPCAGWQPCHRLFWMHWH